MIKIIVFLLIVICVITIIPPAHAAAQEGVTPTLYCLGSCTVTGQPGSTTAPNTGRNNNAPTATTAPGGASPAPDLNPCETTVNVARSGRKRHKPRGNNNNGLFGRLLQWLINFLNMLLQLIGGGQIPVAPSPGTPADPNNPNSPDNPCTPTPSTAPQPDNGNNGPTAVPTTPVNPDNPNAGPPAVIQQGMCSQPAPTLTPAASPQCTTNVWQNLETCGWPGPKNTGYPAGKTFSVVDDAPFTITADNTVIDGYKLTGGVIVAAKNVTIRNSWISMNTKKGASGDGVINIHPGGSATIEHNLLDGMNATHACIWHEGTSMTARYNLCQGANDGIFSWATTEGKDGAGDNFVIENNYFHAFTTQAGNGHIDGYQAEGAKNGIIKHNTIDVSQDQNATVSIWNSRKSSDNIRVENNLLAGGGAAIYNEDYSPSEANPSGGYTVTNTCFVNNRFSTVHFPCVGNYMIWFPRGNPSDKWNRTGNTVIETGQNVDNTNTINGRTCN